LVVKAGVVVVGVVLLQLPVLVGGVREFLRM
jgi:hypothetical protein